MDLMVKEVKDMILWMLMADKCLINFTNVNHTLLIFIGVYG